jgi:hypothetical protein
MDKNRPRAAKRVGLPACPDSVASRFTSLSMTATGSLLVLRVIETCEQRAKREAERVGSIKFQKK